MSWLLWVLVAVVGYLLGNFSTGILIARIFGGIDLRKHGSGNAGTTNAFRVLGAKASGLTLLGDCLKGVLATAFGLMLLGPDGAMLGGIFAIIGHNWPVVFGFKGGKGIATSLGVLLVVQWQVGLFLLLTFIVIVILTRTVSIGSVTVVSMYPLYNIVFLTKDWKLIVLSLIVGALGLFSHRANIVRIMKGEEKPLKFRRG